MRIHLGHHFYGAGNLGDDFMLAGFLAAMAVRAPGTTFSCCVPFPLAPLRRRFPEVDWLPYEEEGRRRAIAASDAWLGLGGSPFQSALSSWFVDHLAAEATLCRRAGKAMYFLGIGTQDEQETARPEVRRLCAEARGIWTRDTESAERIARAAPSAQVSAGTDLAHVWFEGAPPPAAQKGRVTLVANFDYQDWPGQTAYLDAMDALRPQERIWLAQESRELPGAEKALHAALPAGRQAQWRLVAPEQPGEPLRVIMAGWPSGEWLVTARYHAAIAGAWAGSKVVVIGTNEKLRGAARELNVPLVAPDATADDIFSALTRAQPCPAPARMAERARAACAELVEALQRG